MSSFHTRWLGALAAACALGAPARAQDAPPPDRESAPAESPEAAALRQEAIGQFDANDDGALTGDEVGRARAFLQALRGEVGDRGRQRARGGARPGRPARAAEEAPPQPGGPGPAPPRPPRDGRRGPMAVFEQYDADGDGLLSRDEFLGFWNSRGDRPGRMGPPEGRRLGGPGGGPRGPAFGRPPGEGDGDRPLREGRGPGGPDRERGPRLDEAPPFDPGPGADQPPADGSA